MSKTWLAHECTHPECPTIDIDGQRNHSQYLCYRQTHHLAPAPLRPVIVGIVEQLVGDEARQAREAASGGSWRRPSQHFAYDEEAGGELLTGPLPDEDWPGWPEMPS